MVGTVQLWEEQINTDPDTHTDTKKPQTETNAETDTHDRFPMLGMHGRVSMTQQLQLPCNRTVSACITSTIAALSSG